MCGDFWMLSNAATVIKPSLQGFARNTDLITGKVPYWIQKYDMYSPVVKFNVVPITNKVCSNSNVEQQKLVAFCCSEQKWLADTVRGPSFRSGVGKLGKNVRKETGREKKK